MWLSLVCATSVLIMQATPDAGTPRDAVRELVRSHLAALNASAAGTERLEPGVAYFANPQQPRFVNVSLELHAVTPTTGWVTRQTRFAGFDEGHEWVVDRQHLRIITDKVTSESVRRWASSAQAQRDQLLAVVRLALSDECRPTTIDAARFSYSGRNDEWTFTVSCAAEAAARLVSIEVGSRVVRLRSPDATTASAPTIDWLNRVHGTFTALAKRRADAVVLRDELTPQLTARFFTDQALELEARVSRTHAAKTNGWQHLGTTWQRATGSTQAQLTGEGPELQAVKLALEPLFTADSPER